MAVHMLCMWATSLNHSQIARPLVQTHQSLFEATSALNLNISHISISFSPFFSSSPTVSTPWCTPALPIYLKITRVDTESVADRSRDRYPTLSV